MSFMPQKELVPVVVDVTRTVALSLKWSTVTSTYAGISLFNECPPLPHAEIDPRSK